MTIDSSYLDLKEFCDDLFDHPELGYKEFRTKNKIMTYLNDKNIHLPIEEFSTTGMKIALSNDKDHSVAFVAELDAVYAPSHFNSDKETGAAHNCGHFTQVSIALALIEYYVHTKAYESLDFNLVFVFVPAEEYLDLEYRKQLVEEDVIQYYGGKPEAMRLGVFDEIDFAISIHSIGEYFNEPTIEINCDLAGFLYKTYTFKGKASHAGFDPFSGVNAYNMSTVFHTALGLRRQQIKDDETVRINPIVLQSDMSTNVIPNEITIGTDLRTQSVDYMTQVAHWLDDIAKGAALTQGGDVDIVTQMGYLPFVQNRYLNEFVAKAFDKSSQISHMIADRGSIAAAGDIGDLSFMMPCIQVSYGGFKGTIHGDDFKLDDPEFVLKTFPKFLVQVFEEMSGQIDYNQLYKRSYSEYERLIEIIMK
ncbi:M20/M25/M40 family metallo-hydrolase [Dolosicoccus paucivorans]|uniref:M20/M25/M40 family metallo-hydrolase n=1 Tax=Dolosicoccus paucivorans TaxID=84521 RepID=UPI00087EF772|nr:M20/M25/M40 family metallo-hydrolase [Dolosicoccus paucivorans]SDI50897.1 amidohydrolase [Dolosicoccus paucivorans]